MPSLNIFSIKIGGQAGQGIKSAGLMLAKLAVRSGYHTYDYTEYPSLIRGGHNTIQVLISAEEVTSPLQKVDLLVALNQETIDRHILELSEGSGLIFDSEKDFDTSKATAGVNLFPIPLSKLAADSGGEELLSNTVALGAVCAVMGTNLQILKDLIGEGFAEKNQEIVETNQKAAQAGFDFALNHFPNQLQSILNPVPISSPLMVINGNDAVALGAIAAGMQFAAIYPMSPISNILHILASNQEKYQYIYKQPEDEISAINMAIGASFAGARSMTTTSGGGYCLMTEGLGLAAITETPLVIINGMRPGPATGMATWSEQGDLQFVLHAAQGDFPRIVLAPGDAQEIFYQTLEAFNLADKYQLPVTILIDKNLCENDQSFPIFNTSQYSVNRGKFLIALEENYQRFAPSLDGVSPRSIPGVGNYFLANSYEHDSTGLSTEKSEERITQMRKRQSKLKSITQDDLPKPKLYGPEQAKLTIVSWGSNKGAILEAIKNFPDVNFLHLTWLNPFPTDEVRNVLAGAQYILDIEANYTGQLAALIKEKTGIEIPDQLLKYDGRPIYPEEIVSEIEKIMK